MRDKKTLADKTKEELITLVDRLQAKNYHRKKALSQMNKSALIGHHYRESMERQVNYWRQEALTLRFKLDQATAKPTEAEVKHASGA